MILPFPILGENRTVFVGHMCDMFAENVPADWLLAILYYCRLFPKNKYIFQTKNPFRFWHLLPDQQHYEEALKDLLPPNSLIGTTIETNRADLLAQISKAPSPHNRAHFLGSLNWEKFITIEPIMDFDLEPLMSLLIEANPTFVNIGADSKGHNLLEPSRAKVNALIEAIQKQGIEIRKKMNLERLV
jgi:hypothetical protein